jgi:signal transduction histidine kinase
LIVLAASFHFLHKNSRLAVDFSVDAGRSFLSNHVSRQLHNHVEVAVSSISSIYDSASADDAAAQERAKEILRNIRWGTDGYFFVYRYDGTNLVLPHDRAREGTNMLGLRDADGKPLIKALIATARNGGGQFVYKWERPSTGVIEDKVSYVVGLEKWQWIVGTGSYYSSIAGSVDDLGERVSETVDRAALSAWLIISAVGVLSLIASAVIYMRIAPGLQTERQSQPEPDKKEQSASSATGMPSEGRVEI